MPALRSVVALLFISSSLFSRAQPAKDSFTNNLKLIIRNSSSGFIDYRYNELQGNGSLTYSTTLPSLGFDKKFVQTGIVTPYKKTQTSVLPFYIATSTFSNLTSADDCYYRIKRQIIQALRPAAQDSSIASGFSRRTKFMVSKPVNDSFVTVELLILPDTKMNIVALRIFNSKASLEKGNMKSPPVVINKSKNHYQQLVPLIQALMGYSPDNFRAIRGSLLQNEEWSPTYTSIVTFSDLSLPKIEYVTDNLWNQYTTKRYFKEKSDALQRFSLLAAEIDQSKSVFTNMRYEDRSKEDDKWWYFDQRKTDVDGKSFKNTIRLSLVKFKYGDGYYVIFEFRKSVG